jgi:hypothetical protein
MTTIEQETDAEQEGRISIPIEGDKEKMFSLMQFLGYCFQWSALSKSIKDLSRNLACQLSLEAV